MRMRAAGGLLVLLLALPHSSSAAADGDDDPFRQDGAPRRTREFREKVNAAIDRGVAMLADLRQRGAIAAHGLGGDALVLYTLRSCGLPADHALIARGYDGLRRAFDAAADRGGGLDTYGTSLFLMAMEAHLGGDPADPAARARSLPVVDVRRMQVAVQWLVRSQGDGGGFSYQPNQGSLADSSNSQYAILGLKAARRCGVDVPTVVWERAVRYWLEGQEADGPAVPRRGPSGVDEEGYASGSFRTVGSDRARGWSYHARSKEPCSGSMTVAGISSLAICLDELRGTPRFGARLQELVTTALRDGGAWMGLRFAVAGNPVARRSSREGATPMPTWHYYYLYGLERAGMLSGAAWFGEHDWYGEGAEFLVREQRADGTWRPESGMEVMAPALDTCFALLFLKRATFRLGPRGTATDDALEGALDLSGAPALPDVGFRPVFDAVLARYRKAPPARRPALARDFVRLGPRCLPLLIVLLDDPDEAVRADACDALERVTGDARGFRADGPDVLRARAIAAWEAWWLGTKDRLRADEAAGRFIEG